MVSKVLRSRAVTQGRLCSGAPGQEGQQVTQGGLAGFRLRPSWPAQLAGLHEWPGQSVGTAWP